MLSCGVGPPQARRTARVTRTASDRRCGGTSTMGVSRASIRTPAAGTWCWISMGSPSGRPRNSEGLKTHPTRTNFLGCPPIGVSPSLQARFSGNCQSGSPACLRPVRCLGCGGRGSPEGPPPAFRSGSCALRRGQGFRHGLELLQQLLVAPVGVGHPFTVQVHQLAEAQHLGLESEVLCTGVASNVIAGVFTGDSTGVFTDIIHEDPDCVPSAVLLGLSCQLAALDHSIES